MAKRFTATEKWSDSWYRALPPLHKNGWQYLCDACDAAGIVDLDRELGNFLVGDTLDWDALIEAAGERIVRLSCGKLWLRRFISFQYGELSRDCIPHRAVLEILGKYAKTERVLEEYLKGCQTLQEKEKEKDKDKDRKGSKGKPKRVESQDVPVPDGWNTGDVLQAIRDWLEFKTKRGESYKDASYLGRKIAEFPTPADFIASVNSSIGNNYSGLFPAKGSNGKPAAPAPEKPYYKINATKFRSLEESSQFKETTRSVKSPTHIRGTTHDGMRYECIDYPLPGQVQCGTE
jgi:hypothetical protein